MSADERKASTTGGTIGGRTASRTAGATAGEEREEPSTAAAAGEVASDDVVASVAAAEGNARVPLIVRNTLTRFLDEHELGAGELTASPIGEGHSNVTYLITRDGLEAVVRRPPRPPLPPSAHDVLREARLLRALRGTAARVPAVLAVCEREDVIGAPFYVMEKVEGEALTTQLPPALDDPQQRRAIGQELIDALVEIHGVDWRAAGLEGFGKPTGYLERQLRRWSGLWALNKTREIPAVERVGEWLAQGLPHDAPAASVVHGDYRLGNAMFATNAPARLLAVLDWEMATIGDPLADLGYLCMMWTEADDPSDGLREHIGRVTRAPGFLTRAELIERYERGSGRAMGDLRWYTTLALWKSIVFMEGNYRRAVAGSTDDPYLKQFGEGVVELAERAQEVAFGE
ncbi:MAG: phosphotransferase family protein [Solirubrobacteraceae bacterium]